MREIFCLVFLISLAFASAPVDRNNNTDLLFPSILNQQSQITGGTFSTILKQIFGSERRAQSTLSKAFSQFDSSRDGYLTGEEIRLGIEKLQSKTHKNSRTHLLLSHLLTQYSDFITAFDPSGDRLISLDEFVTAAMEYLRTTIRLNADICFKARSLLHSCSAGFVGWVFRPLSGLVTRVEADDLVRRCRVGIAGLMDGYAFEKRIVEWEARGTPAEKCFRLRRIVDDYNKRTVAQSSALVAEQIRQGRELSMKLFFTGLAGVSLMGIGIFGIFSMFSVFLMAEISGLVTAWLWVRDTHAMSAFLESSR